MELVKHLKNIIFIIFFASIICHRSTVAHPPGGRSTLWNVLGKPHTGGWHVATSTTHSFQPLYSGNWIVRADISSLNATSFKGIKGQDIKVSLTRAWRRGRGPLHDDVKYRYGTASGASSNPFYTPLPPSSPASVSLSYFI